MRKLIWINSCVTLPLVFAWAVWLMFNGIGLNCVIGCDSVEYCEVANILCSHLSLKIQFPNGSDIVAVVDTGEDLADGNLSTVNPIRKKSNPPYRPPDSVVNLILVCMLLQFYCFNCCSTFLTNIRQELSRLERATTQTRISVIDSLIRNNLQHFRIQGEIITLFELLGLIVVCIQIYIMTWYGGDATSITTTVSLLFKEGNYSPRTDKLFEMFPTMVSCSLEAGLNQAQHLTSKAEDPNSSSETLCLIPSNDFYEKLFLVLYFWIKMLFAVLVFRSLFKFSLNCSSSLRKAIFVSNLVMYEYENSRILYESVVNSKISKFVSASELVFLLELKNRVPNLVFVDFLKLYTEKLHGRAVRESLHA